MHLLDRERSLQDAGKARSGDCEIMGKLRNGRLATILGWGETVAMTAAGVVGVWQLLD
jgi:hypothetical protein